MTVKRIIPCLDIDQGRVVKGTHFSDLKDMGDPIEMACFYEGEGADELVLLDISATVEGRKTFIPLVSRVAQSIRLPFTVGGGIKSLEDMEEALAAGASKVAVNTAAVEEPSLILRAAKLFGSSRLVVAIDAKREGGGWQVYTHGGKNPAGKGALEWSREVEDLGAGEILLTSIDHDGTRQGYDLELLARIREKVSLPVIASGGAGSLEDFYRAITVGGADGVLAASVFHLKIFSIRQVKEYLHQRGIPVKLEGWV
ncbi:MAG TPA: imidazole glycerol phosphate synthase subunit HisF [Moorella mulderi]|nr:imidazole glycerol phosphate synthase subunit HisF [Moorella mulderi]